MRRTAEELSPCGYALFEEGVALTELGQPEAAIPILERRLNEYGDNEQRRGRSAAAQRAQARPAARTAELKLSAPARRCKARMAAPALAPSTPALSAKPRLLCVDDEPIVLEALRDVLRRTFDVRVATSGREALAMLRREPRGYAVVLSRHADAGDAGLGVPARGAPLRADRRPHAADRLRRLATRPPRPSTTARSSAS